MNRVKQGVNDLYTWCLNNGEQGQRILNEWTGVEINKETNSPTGVIIDIHCVAYSGHKYLKWRCSNCGESFNARVDARTHQNITCNRCKQNEKKLNDNYRQATFGVDDLYTWCINHGDFGRKLLKEWTGISEKGNKVDIKQVKPGANIEMKWKCEAGHIFKAPISRRTYNRTSCSFCSGKQVSSLNSLSTWCDRSGNRGKQIKTEFMGFKDTVIDGIHYKGDKITLDTMSYGSNDKVWWRCAVCGYEWTVSITNRTSHLSDCPACKKMVASENYSLKTWCEQNGEYGQILMKEFTGETRDGSILEIDKITHGMVKELKWMCDKGHVFWASPNVRTNNLTRCKECRAVGTSYQEQFIFNAIKQLFTNALNRYKTSGGLEFDIYIPEKEVYIEYSPTIWHNEGRSTDRLKQEYCKLHNLQYINIIEDSYNELKHGIFGNIICFRLNYRDQNKDLCKLVSIILKLIGAEELNKNINYIKAAKDAFIKMGSNVKFEDSLTYKYPELAKEINEGLSGITGDQIQSGYNKKIFWTCVKCGYGSNGEWLTSPDTRTQDKSGCPCCGYNWYTGKINKQSIKIVKAGVNDLTTIFPYLAAEWHPDNKQKPCEYRPGSGTTVKWLCQRCGREFELTINSRANGKTGCSRCGYNWYKAQTGQPQPTKYLKWLETHKQQPDF